MRFIITAIAALLLLTPAVEAQEEWDGPQWEYLLTEVKPDGTVIVHPMIGELMARIEYAQAIDAEVDAIAPLQREGVDSVEYPFYLQVLGGHGWEMVGSVTAGSRETQIFKRPRLADE